MSFKVMGTIRYFRSGFRLVRLRPMTIIPVRKKENLAVTMTSLLIPPILKGESEKKYNDTYAVSNVIQSILRPRSE